MLSQHYHVHPTSTSFKSSFNVVCARLSAQGWGLGVPIYTATQVNSLDSEFWVFTHRRTAPQWQPAERIPGLNTSHRANITHHTEVPLLYSAVKPKAASLLSWGVSLIRGENQTKPDSCPGN